MEQRRESIGGLAPRSSPVSGGSDDAAHALAAAVRVLHVNGAETDRAQVRAEQLGKLLGTPATAHLGWSRSTVEFGGSSPLILPFADPPSAVALNRVAAVDDVIQGLRTGQANVAEAREAVAAAGRLPAADLPLFVAACSVGAVGLALILGVQHWGTVAIIAVSAGLGAIVRRLLGRAGLNNYWQVGAAGVIAGLGGALDGALGLSSALGLAALCPCLILVPGPHLLKGALDIGSLRIELGIARLTFAAITLIAIGSGLLIGLAVGGARLVANPPARTDLLWIDVPVAGVVAICYGVFYSAPLRMLVWPLVVGAAAHGLHWLLAIPLHAPAWLSAGTACLLVGAVLRPIALTRNVPFSAIGFASVVSLLPGANLFRALAGLVSLQHATARTAEPLLVATVDDLVTAGLTVLAMTIGFLAPFEVWRRVFAHAARPRPEAHE